MLSFFALSLVPVGALAASPYAPVTSTCPSESLVRSANGISEQEEAYITSRKAKADFALHSWLATVLPDVDSSSLPSLALAVSGGGFRSLLTGAGVIQAMDSRENTNFTTSGLYQALTYQAGLSGGAWLLSAIAEDDWPTISDLRDNVWETQFAGGILNATIATTVGDYSEIAEDIIEKGNAGYPVSLTDPWGRMLSYQIMAGSEGGVDTKMSSLTTMSNFTSYNVPFPIITASKIDFASGECSPTSSEAIVEFNPYEFGSWSDDVSAFVQMAYLGSDISAGVASACTTLFDNLNWVLGTSSMLLNEYICDPSLGVDVASLFPAAMITVVELFTSTAEYGYAMVPNPFKGFVSTTTTANSSVADLDTLYLVDGGEPDRNTPILPLLEPTRNVSVLIVSENSNNVNAYPDGTSLVAAWTATQNSRLKGRFPTVPAAGSFSTTTAQFFGCGEADAVTVVYLPNSQWAYSSNTATLKLLYTATQTTAMIENGNDIATQGGDENWGTCLACGIMLKEVGQANLPNGCAACLTKYCWPA